MNNTTEKKWEEIVLPNTGRRQKVNWYDNTYVAYTTTFVYSKYNGNFIIKGYANDVRDYLKENHSHYFYNMVLHNEGKHRSIWRFWNDNWSLYNASLIKRGSFWAGNQRVVGRKPFKMIKRGTGKKTYTFKRMPKRWIPLFDKCI